MALRTVTQRWPASPLLQNVFRAGLLQSRSYADEYTGKNLDEKEKAAETRYIKKMEEEQRLRKAKGSPGAPPGTPEAPTIADAAATAKSATDSGFRTTAVVAGLIAAVAGYWLLSGSSKKEEKETSQ